MWMFLGLVTLIGSFLLARAIRRDGRWEGETHTLGGTQLYQRLEGHDRGRLASLALAVRCPRGLSLTVKRETGLDTRFKRFGISREFQTGQRAVDEAVYIVSENPRLEALFRSNRAAATLLLRISELTQGAARFHRLLCVDGQLSVQFKIHGDFNAEQALVRRAIPMLYELAASLEEAASGPRPDASQPFAAKAATLLSINLSLGITAFAYVLVLVSAVWPQFVDSGWLWALLIGALLLATLLLWAWRWLGRSSRAHLVMLELLLVGSISCTLCGHFLAWQLNGMTAFAGPVEQRRLEGFQLRPGGRGSPKLVVTDWEHPTRRVTLTIDRDTYQQLRGRRNLPVEVLVRRGALGLRMVHELRMVPAEPP